MVHYYKKNVTTLVLFLILFSSRQLLAQNCNLTYYAGIAAPTSGTNFATWASFGPGQYVAFPALAGASYGISTCGGGLDTQLTGWDPSASAIVFYNDDFGPLCSTSEASIDGYVPNFTSYMYIQITQYNCAAGGSSSINVYFRQNDNIVFTSSSAAMCSGQTRVLSATPGNVGSTPGGFGNPGTFSGTGVSGNIFTAPVVASPTNYTITYTFGYVSHTQVITVNPLPTVGISVSAATICKGNSTTLSGTGASSYAWTGGITNGVAFAPSNSATYFVTGTSAAGCTSTNSASQLITVNPLPTVAISGTAATCSGTFATLTASGASSYVWNTGAVTAAIAVAPVSSTNYTVTGTNAFGCVDTDTFALTVQPNPTVVITGTNATCNGTGVTLTGSGASTYTWNTGPTTAAISVTPAGTTNYTLTGTSAVGCKDTDTFTLTVQPLPTVTANSTATVICRNTAITLSGSGANTYTWTASVGTATNGVAFSPTTTATYSLTGTSAVGCLSGNVSAITVTVNQLPVVSASASNTFICRNTAITVNGSGANTYTWTASTGTATDNVAFSPTTTANYTVVGTSTAGCTSTNVAAVTVTVNPLPTVTANSSNTFICINTAITLSGGGANTYTWTASTGTATNNIAFTPTTTATYSVVGTSTAGCTSTNVAAITVTVNPLPTVSATTSTTSICYGNNVTVNGSGASTYTWVASAGGNPTNATAFSPTVTASYSVTGTSTAGCTSTNVAAVTITVQPTLLLKGNGNSVPAGVTTSTNNNTDFGTNSARTFSVSNSGAGTLTLGTIYFTGPNAGAFSVTTVPSGAITTGTTGFVITLTPTNTGISTATVNIPTNDCTNSTYSFVVTASTTAASALYFDGNNDYVAVPNAASLQFGTGNFTKEAWIKYSSTAGNYAGLIVKGTSGTGIFHQLVLFNDKLAAQFYDGTTVVGVADGLIGTTSLNNGTWHHVAMVRNGSNVKLYVDGIQEASVTHTLLGTTMTTTNSLLIGTDRTSSVYFPGQMDEVRLWNTARTQCELQTYMNAEITSTASGLVANYHFNQGIPAGTNSVLPYNVLTDAAGSNTGALTNFVLTGTVSNWVSPGGVISGSTTPASVTASITVSGNGNSVPQGATTSTSNNTDFGTSASKTFLIANPGGGTLNINGIYLTGTNASQFSVTTSPAASITTGTTGFAITLTPTNTGISTATVNIPSNDCGNPTYSFVITATTSPASALNFDGLDDYVSTPSSASLNTSAFTIETWLKWQGSGSTVNFITSKGYENMEVHTGGTMSNSIRFIPTTGVYLDAGVNSITPNTWFHLACVYNPSVGLAKMYINGTSVNYSVSGSNPITTSITPNAIPLYIGARTSGLPYYFSGNLDELRIWNVARTQCEIQTYMNAEITGTASGLVANYHFNQGIPAGTNSVLPYNLLTDATGANTGTLTNFDLSGSSSNWVTPGGVANGFTTSVAPSVTLAAFSNGNSIPAASTTPTVSNNTSFGNLCVGGSTVTKTYSVSNTGTNVLNINVVLAGSSAYTLGTYPATIAPGGSGTFPITLSPGSSSAVPVTTVNIYSNDCANPNYSFVINATVNALPSAIISSPASNTAICSGQTASILALGVGPGSYTIGFTNTNSQSIFNGTPFTPTSTATYSAYATDVLTGCTGTTAAVVTITVNALPTVTPNASSTSICSGQTVSVFAFGANTFTWVASAGSNPLNGIPFTPTTTATYSVSGTNVATGCTSTNAAVVTVTVNAIPSVTASASSPVICNTQTITVNGSGASTYTWVASTGTATNNIAFSPSLTATYSVSGTSTAGCTSTNVAAVTVTVNALPTLTISGTGTVCNTFASTLTVSGASTYTWNTTATTSSIVVSPSVTTTYTATGTNSNSCVNSNTFVLTVNPLPVVTANASGTFICINSSLTLNGSGADTYTWTASSGSATNNIAFTPTTTATYSVTGTNTLTGCTSTNAAAITVTVNPLPTVSAAATSSSVCYGTTVAVNGSGANTYTWTASAGSNPLNATAFSPTVTANYTVVGTSTAGCTSTNVAAVTITVQPTLSIKGNGNNVPVGAITGTNNNTDFGSNTSRTFSVNNAGAGTLTLGTIFLTGPNAGAFSVTTVPSTAITTGTTGFVITLTPTNTGVSTATVNIPSNDCTNSTYSFVITASTSPASALAMDGIDDVVNIAHTSSLNAFPFTAEAWFKTSYNGNQGAAIIGKYVSGSGNGWSIYVINNHIEAYYFNNPSNFVLDPLTGNTLATSTVNITDNNWHHVAFTVDNSGGRIYIDGNLRSAVGTWSGTASAPTTTTNVQIGAFTSFFLPMQIDEARMWNVARSQCQLQQFMNAEITSTASGLMANYHFNQGIPSGNNALLPYNILTDAAGSNTGTLTNNMSLTGTVSNWVSPGGVTSGFTTTAAPSVTLAAFGNGNSIPAGSGTPTVSNNTSFGNLCIGGSTVSRTYSVSNTGTTALNINIVLSGSTAFTLGTYPSTVAPGGSTTFPITFNPGTSSAVPVTTVSIYSNDCATPNYSFVINATVNALPSVTAAASNTVICNTQTITVNGSGANTYTWAASAGTATNGVAFSPSVTATYSVAGTSSLTGCTSTNVAFVAVTVNTLPIVSAATSTTALCIGNPVTLNGSGANTYTWLASTGTATNNIAFTPTTTANYSVTGTNTLTGCTSTNAAAVTVTVYNLPVVTANSSSTVICRTQSITLTGSGASTYTWNASSGTATNNVAFAPLVTAVYSVTGTSSVGCLSSNVSTIAVTVNTLPVVSAATSTSAACFGQSVTLTGSGANTYTWLASAGTATNGVAFSPTTTANYSVSGTNTLTGCTSTNIAAVSVTVYALPSLTISGNASICNGGNSTLTASGANTYTWSTSAISASVVLSPTVSTPYTVTATDVNGCVNNAVKTVSVGTLPVVSVTTSSAVICAGGTTTFNASGAVSYTLTTSSGTVPLGISYTPAASASYSLVGTSSAGCTSTNNAVVAVTVNPLPTISITGNGTICNTFSSTLTASGASTYTWNTSAISASIVASPSTTTTYTATGTNSNSCINSNTFVLTVNQLPVVSANTNSTAICFGQSVTLNGGGASTYTWNASTGTATNNVAFAPSVTATYSVVGTSSAACISTNVAFVTVTVYALPSVTAAASSSVICNTQTITVNGSGANTYTWSTASGPVANATPFAPSVTTTYSLAGTNTLTGCTSTNNPVVAVTVNTLPIVSASSSTNALCIGNQVTLNGSGANTYTWLASSGTATNNVAFAPTVTASYSVTGTNALTGCTSTNAAVVTVTVYTLPTVTANASSVVICRNQTVSLSGSGASSYSWTSLLAGTYTNNVSFSPTATAVYSVVGTSSNGCISSNTSVVSVTVNQLPVVTASVTNSVVCFGQSVTLTGGGANTYTWLATSLTASNGIAFAPSVSDSYSVTGTNTLTGCTSTNVAFVAVTVNTLPIVSVNTSTTELCIGKSVTLNGSGANTYTWTSSAPGTYSNNVSFNPTVTASYSVSGTNTLTGCTSTNVAAITLTVYSLPTVSASSSGSVICYGQTVTLNGSGANTYTWIASSGTATDNISFSPSVTANYSVIGTSSNGCISSNTAVTSITVNALPTLSVAVSKNVLCFGDSTALTASGALTHTWSTGVINGGYVSPSASGVFTYSVTSTDNNKCNNSAAVTVTVNAKPVLVVNSTLAQSCGGQSVSLSVSGASTYTWSNGGNGASTVVSPTVTSVYTVSGTDSNGCFNLTPFTQSVIPCTPTPYSKITSMDVTCNLRNDGTILVKDSISSYPYTTEYIWASTVSFKDTKKNYLDHLAAGVYSLSVVLTYTAENNFVKIDTIVHTPITISDVNKGCDLDVFTGISPNGDGNNDSWFIENIDNPNFSKNTVTIFNRWGVIVSEIHGYDNVTKFWPEKKDIDKLPASTYFYIINLGDGSTPKKGWIELIKTE